MKTVRLLRTVAAVLLVAVKASGDGAKLDEAIERLDSALTFASSDANWRMRFSGTLDLEHYVFEDPAPGLVYTGSYNYFTPRLALFADGQVGPAIYFFAQSRVDRGFDPTMRGLGVRLDEYALRYTPWNDGRLTVQVGKFATVIGTWVNRHLSWDNPFVNAPVAYENLTAVWDNEPPSSAGELISWAYLFSPTSRKGEYGDKHLRVPIIWGAAYTTGISLSGKWHQFEYAAEIKNASPSSRPARWDLRGEGLSQPTVSGRIAFVPSPMWSAGLSYSEGTYLDAGARPQIPSPHRLSDYWERIIGQDVSFAWHYWQIWAEVFQARFAVPAIGHADVSTYYVEARYKFTPQFSGAVRWNSEWYGKVAMPGPRYLKWGRDTHRLDLATTYRLAENAQVKFQISRMWEDRPGGADNTLSGQFTLRF